MAGLETVYGHYRYTSGGNTYQGDGWIINNTSTSGHKYTSDTFGDSDHLKLYQSEYGDYYSGHLDKITDKQKQKVNVNTIYNALHSYGFTLQAICGMLGNMQSESVGFNPGVYQGRYKRVWPSVNFGMGLVQWTPNFKLNDWAKDNGDLHIYDIATQLKRIKYQAENNIQYGRRDSFPWSWSAPQTFTEYKSSTQTAKQLAYAFYWYYEKPKSSTNPTDRDKSASGRAANAEYWYNYLSGQPIPPGPGPGPVPGDTPIWLLFKLKNNNWRG